MSRAYGDSIQRLQSENKIDNPTITSMSNRLYRKEDQAPRFAQGEDNNCDPNLFYSFQMQVQECEGNKYTNLQPSYLKDQILQYVCDKCNKPFPSKQSMTAHVRIFHSQSTLVKNAEGNVQHKCEYCHKLFSQATGLAEHRRIHTGERPYKCKVCNKSFSRSIYLCVHSRSHTGQKPYSCKTCNKSFTQKKSLSSHTRIHTGERPFSCTECHKPFARSTYLKIHMRSHSGEKPYACHFCDKAFTQKQSLSVHMKTHTGEKATKKKKSKANDSFGDDTCYTPNGVVDDLLPRDRMLDVESSSSPDIIQNNFMENSSSSSQTQLSTNDNTYVQNLSQREPSTYPIQNFKPKIDDYAREIPKILSQEIISKLPILSKEITIKPINNPSPPKLKYFDAPRDLALSFSHGHFLESGLPFVPLQPNGKPHEYVCKDCGEGFPNLRDLALHERTHTGLYKYQCKLCSKAFRRSYNLRLHMRSHTGEKPYQCTICSKWFTQSSSLLVHMKIHAKEKEEGNQ